jgi:phosphoribosylaminoimidazole-succinocarboxamide synthase
MQSTNAMETARPYVNAPLAYKGKVREMYDLGDHYLIAVTDRISAFDHILQPPVPDKGNVLNLISKFWFEQIAPIHPHHVVHCDVTRLEGIVTDMERMKHRVMVAKKAERIDVECVVRGYVTGGGWRQYARSGTINGIKLSPGLRKNERLPEPIFTPAAKNDVGHDEDITIGQMKDRFGAELTEQLMERSLALYRFAHDYCEQRGIILADTKFEFGLLDGEIILIDEIFTPDSSRYWSVDRYALDAEIDSMDKEPVRTYLANSGWDKESAPPPLPPSIVEETAARYRDILRRLTGISLE